MAMPLAWAVPITVLTSDRANTRSTATTSGRCSSIHASMARSMLTSRWATGRSDEVRTTPTSTSRSGRPTSPSTTPTPHRVSPGSMPSTRMGTSPSSPSEQVFVRNANAAGSGIRADTPAQGWGRAGHTDHPGPRPRSGGAGDHGVRPAAAPAAGVGAHPVRRGRAAAGAESQPSGVRLVFRTRATAVELDAHRALASFNGVPDRPDCFYDLCVDGELAAADDGHRRRHRRARPLQRYDADPPRADGHGAVRRAPRPRQARRAVAALERDHAPGRAADRRPGPTGGRPGPAGLAAPRQLDQPGLGRRQPQHHLAGAGGPRRRRRAGQPRAGRQRAPRPVHRSDDAGHPCRPGQRQGRHQPDQPGPDAPPRLRASGARLPRHDPRGPSRRAAAGRLAAALPDARGDARAGHLRRLPRWPRARSGSRPSATRRRSPRGSSRSGSSARSWPGSWPSAPGPTRRSTTSTGWGCTARRTTSGSRCPTTCTPMATRTGSSASRFAEAAFGPGGAFAQR